jgi:predicted NBD/HSP70 family sugar kinase/biotin operon repressor
MPLMTEPVGSLSSLRTRNRRLVLEAIQTRRADSRAQIVRATGLSRTTVSSLVQELLADGVLVELPERASSSLPEPNGGRPAISLALHPDTGTVVGVHLRHDGVRVALTDLNGTVLREEQRDGDVDHEPAGSLAYVAHTAHEIIEESGVDPARVVAMGIAVSAPVRLGSHALSLPSMLDDWNDIDIAARLRELTGLPVHVGNDANLGAVAEWKFGAARCVDDVVYVMLADGVGAGLILRGELYEGATGASGELGHVAVAGDGYICRCGNRGCLETVAGSRALIDALAHTRGPQTTLADVLTLSTSGDPGAQRVIVDAGRAVGRALAGICTVLDPRMIVIGGKVAAAGVPLLDGIRDVLARSLPPVTNQGIQVVAGELGDRAEVLGAIAIAGQSAAAHLLA